MKRSVGVARPGLVFVLLAGPAMAHAFCGAYVGAAGAELYNHSSQIMIARTGSVTTLTVANEYQGDSSDFALVIPIPEVVDASQVWTVAPEIFDRTDTYSSPRTVQYTCADAITETHAPLATGCGLMFGCADSNLAGGTYDTGGGNADGVTVEAQFDVAEYEIAVLSADGGEGLTAWLALNDYAMPAGGEEILQEYIDAGSYFLAAKIRLDALPAGQTWLSPLRFSYTSEVFSLPLRIGTIASEGVQDLLIYVMTDEVRGEVGIANYEKVALPDECMLPPDLTDGFGSYFESLLDEAVTHKDRAGWIVEYGWKQPAPSTTEVWGAGHCDPCIIEDTGPVLIAPAELGHAANSGHFTRIHMRYRPDQVDEDIVFYFSEQTDNAQLRYIEYKRELEFLFPICGQGYADDPGRCGDALDEDRPPPVSCSAPVGSAGSYLVALAALALLRRRRR